MSTPGITGGRHQHSCVLSANSTIIGTAHSTSRGGDAAPVIATGLAVSERLASCLASHNPGTRDRFALLLLLVRVLWAATRNVRSRVRTDAHLNRCWRVEIDISRGLGSDAVVFVGPTAEVDTTTSCTAEGTPPVALCVRCRLSAGRAAYPARGRHGSSRLAVKTLGQRKKPSFRCVNAQSRAHRRCGSLTRKVSARSWYRCGTDAGARHRQAA